MAIHTLLARNPVVAPLIATLVWALYLVMARVVVFGMGLHPWAFAATQMFVAGLFMLAVAGKRDPASTARPTTWRDAISPWTLAIGAMRVVVVSSTSAALGHLPVAQASLLGTLNAPFSALLVFLLRRARFKRGETLGYVAMAVGETLIVLALPGAFGHPGALWQMLSETSAVAASLLAEFHPANRGDDIGERVRLTGWMLVSASVVFFLGWSGLGALGAVENPLTASGLGAFGDWRLWALGAVAGVLFRGPGMYLSLYSVRYSGTATYMAALGLLPFLAIGLEALAATAGIMPGPALGWSDILAATIIFCGSAAVIATKARLI
jgi:hypothetical protein